MCAYVQKRSDDVYNVKFMAAKSRVAPLRQVNIPRLELQAAVLASRLAKSVQEESRIQFGNMYFFADSTITLAWIQSPSRNFKPFVSSRIEKCDVRINNMVIMADSNGIRGKWTIGRIIEVYPGSDGQVCNVKVKKPTGEYSRPVTNIAVIHPAEGYN